MPHPTAMPAADPPKARVMALLWLLALGLSAALDAAGRRWSDPLFPEPLLVWSLLLAPPLATGAWLLRGWSLPPAGQEGQSEASNQEQQR
jgi:hypothetical protein